MCIGAAGVGGGGEWGVGVGQIQSIAPCLLPSRGSSMGPSLFLKKNAREIGLSFSTWAI